MTQPARLDRLLCLLNRQTHGALGGSIDTLREMGRWITRQRPARLVPPAKHELKGEKRKARAVVDFSAYPDWPYCEHCGRLSELGETLVFLGHAPSGGAPGRSPRFCARHNPATSPATTRRRTRFMQVLHAIQRELSQDEPFRARFIQRAWEQAGATVLRQENVMTFAANAVHAMLITDPVESYARECAYQMARRHVDRTELAIAKLRAEGMNQSDIGRKLGLSRQAISLRISKASGIYDFSRRSPLLYWWPDSAIVRDNALNLSRPDVATTA